MPEQTPDQRIATAQTPSEFIQAWSLDVLTHDLDDGGIIVPPSPETLREVESALHAVQEFLIEPIGAALKTIVAKYQDDDRTGQTFPMPEDERMVDFADVGRLIVWADTLRAELGYTLDAVQTVALLAHDDLAALAAGYVSDGQSITPGSWNKHLRRFHGLDEVG